MDDLDGLSVSYLLIDYLSVDDLDDLPVHDLDDIYVDDLDDISADDLDYLSVGGLDNLSDMWSNVQRYIYSCCPCSCSCILHLAVVTFELRHHTSNRRYKTFTYSQ